MFLRRNTPLRSFEKLGYKLTKLLGEVDLVLLDQGGAGVQATGLEEGKDHAAADYKLVALGHERVDHTDLGRHLRCPTPVRHTSDRG